MSLLQDVTGSHDWFVNVAITVCPYCMTSFIHYPRAGGGGVCGQDGAIQGSGQ